MFAAVAMAQSTEETRYYLNGVYVCPHPTKGAMLVATDGHRMMVAHDELGSVQKPAICGMPKGAIALKFNQPTVQPSVEVDTDGIATVATYRSERSVYIDGTYPDWAAVIRPVLELGKKRFYGKEIYAPASFNGDYLAAFGKIAKVLRDCKDSVAVRVITFNEHDPALILFPYVTNAFGILMPMRASVPGNAIPGFMKDVLEPPRARAAKRKAA